MRQRYGNTVKNSRSYPGADVVSDYNLVLMDVKIRFKKIKRSQKRKKWRFEGIEEKAAAFQKEVSQRLSVECNRQGRSVEEDWQELVRQ